MTTKRIIPESELVLNSNKSVYHLHLLADQIADDVILVGDQNRVSQVSKFFDSIECKVENREFVTHTGYFNKKCVTVCSTGIGTDNIDIVVNELDAAINIDPVTRTVNENLRSLNLVRIGTSGALQKDIAVDTFVISEYGLGFDGLLYYYNYHPDKDETSLLQALLESLNWKKEINTPYVIKGSTDLFKRLEKGMVVGITATANGFYGPQGRELRLKPNISNLNEQLTNFLFNDKRITNFEMETSALYGLGKMLGHNSCTVCSIVANRITKEFSKDYKKSIDSLIIKVLERLTT